MLSPPEQARLDRGQALKRYVRAAAALRELYDDKAIAQAVGRSRNTVASWWQGAQPEPETLRRLAAVIGLDPAELVAFVYYDGPPPLIVEPASPVESGVREGIRRDQERQQPGDLPAPGPSPAPPPRGTRAGS